MRISYQDIKQILNTFLKNDRIHLFEVDGVHAAFFSKKGSQWRILTSLSNDEAHIVCNSLNDQYGVGRFVVGPRAWHDLSRAKFSNPRMRSQIDVGSLSLDMIRGIWSAIVLFNSGSAIRKRTKIYRTQSPQSQVKTIKNLKGHSVKNIISRLKKD